MFIFYLHSVNNNELIAKLSIDKFNLIAKSRFLLLILLTCLHFPIDRELISPKKTKQKAESRLTDWKGKAGNKEEGWERKSIASSRACPTNLQFVVVAVASAAALLLLLLLLPLANLIWPVPTFALPFSFASFLFFLLFCSSLKPMHPHNNNNKTRVNCFLSWACVCVYCRIT